MRVLIDARMLVGRFSGVARVVTALVEELTRAPGVCVIALMGNQIFKPWRNRTDIELVAANFDRSMRSPLRRIAWEATVLRSVIAASRADIYHATWNHGVPFGCPIPAVLTIHDLIPWRRTVTRTADFIARALYRRAIRSSARRAAVVAAVSDFTRRQVIESLHIDPDRVVTTYNGLADSPPGLPHSDPAERPFVLYVGGHEPRKNIAAVLDGMRSYWDRFGPRVELRLTGSASDLAPAAARAYNRLLTDSPVRFLGRLDDDELAQQYASARALILLSTDEGFGLPVVEAMRFGCPVVAANRSALPEIVGDAGLLIDPDDPQAVAASIRRVILDSPLRADLIVRGFARAAFFSRERFGTATLQLYRRVLAANGVPGHAETAPAVVAVPSQHSAR
jgi:glycosyltransferase involved in cell wall biosynthesis